MRRILVAALAAAAVGAGCGDDLGPARPRPLPAPDDRPALLTPGARSPRIVGYAIDARLDAAARRVTGTVRLTWRNPGETPVDRLPFHLYMNAFKNETTVFMTESRGRHRASRASARHWGWIDVGSIRAQGAELRDRATFPGPDETVLEVPLPAPVGPGASVVVDLTFETQLPEVFARTGFHGPFLMVAQWFPKLGVRHGPPGEEVWHAPPFHLASEFFADFGTYDVTLTVPSTHVVAATGVLVASRDGDGDGDGDTHVLTYRAEDVHDFAWMADPHMEILRGAARTARAEPPPPAPRSARSRSASTTAPPSGRSRAATWPPGSARSRSSASCSSPTRGR